MNLPKGYVLESGSDENQNIKTYIYSDGSRILFSDSRVYNQFPKEAYKKYGDNLNLLFIPRDTITVWGKDSVLKNWKICKCYNVEYGYINVPSDKVESFENILKTFQQRQK